MIRTVEGFPGQGMSYVALLDVDDLQLPAFSNLFFWNHPSLRPETAEERKFRVHRERIEQAGQLRLPFCKEVLR
jgi:hypothetical protein